MFGRGYTKDGHLKAANYIKGEFEKLELKSFNNDYLQRFPLKVNTFPTEPELVFDNEELKIGKDFIIAASSRSIESELDVIRLPNKALNSEKHFRKYIQKNNSEKALLVDLRGLNKEAKSLANQLAYAYAGFPLVIFADSVKLTASMSQSVSKMTIVHVRLKEGGQFPTKVRVKVNSELLSIKSQNILGFLEGSIYPDTFIVFSAHYDHLGGYGDDVYFPGANDNASGIAMMLELADSLSNIDTLKYSVAFIAFGGEEVGLIGSKYFVSNPLIPLDHIKVLINTDILGTGDEGIKMVNATKNMHVYNAFVELNEKLKLLSYIGKRGPAANSDHYFFGEKGVPAVFIYTLGGISAYHDVFDCPETLPLTKFSSIEKLILSYILVF